MTEEEIEAAKNLKKDSIKLYINVANKDDALAAIQMLISALITQAGSLENLTLLEAALAARFGPHP